MTAWTSLTDEEREEVRRLTSATPSPASHPVLLGRFFRRMNELGLDASFWATNPDLS